MTVRMKPHECDCSLCEVTEVPMTAEEIAEEEHLAAVAEQEESDRWRPARDEAEAVWRESLRTQRGLMDSIARSLYRDATDLTSANNRILGLLR